MKDYKHPKWMQAAGWVVVLVMSWMAFKTIAEFLA